MKTIVCPVDFSEGADNAALFAWEIAQRSRANMVLLHARYIPALMPYSQSYLGAESAAESLDEVAGQMNKLRDRMLRVAPSSAARLECHITHGVPVEEIINFVNSRHPDLVVMGTEGVSGAIEAWLGTRAAQVIERAECPVLVIPSHAWAQPFTHVVYTTDGQNDDPENIDLVVRLIRLFATKISVLHLHAGDQNQEVAIRRIIGRLSISMPYSTISGYMPHFENVAEGIVQFVKDSHADLLVMATRERNVIQQIFFRGLTKHMVYYSPIPVLAMHKSRKLIEPAHSMI